MKLARPSELANLTADKIVLDAEVPYIDIQTRDEDDEDGPREIKSVASFRKIPLVGVALAVFRKNPQGFPRYRDRGNNLSAAVQKHFKLHKLFPTPKHAMYSLRHSFEDRMKTADIDTELRKMLMGHTDSRPQYGIGGSLKWQRDHLLKIALPFDPAIV